MALVPVAGAPPASHEAQEIAREIERVIARYQDEHPHATQCDIQQALRLAQTRAAGVANAARSLIAAAIGVLLMLGVVAFMLLGGGDIPWVAISGIGVMVIAIVPLVLLLKQK